MRKNRIGLNLLDMTDSYGDFPEVYNEDAETIQKLIENLLYDIKILKEDVRRLKYGRDEY